jgi:YfiH family protein
MIVGMVFPQPSDGFEWVQAAAGPALRCAPLQAIADHLYTTRPWRLGSASGRADDGWDDVAAAMSVAADRLARLHQVHGADVLVARSPVPARRPPSDIVITDDAAIAVAVQAADCVPLLAADRRTGAVGAGHAGWRGLVARVPDQLIAAMRHEFGTEPADVVAAIGPSIGACCYEVGADVRGAFRAAGFTDRECEGWFFERPRATPNNPSMPRVSAAGRADHWFFDSWASARRQLEDAGVPAAQIHVAELCTASHEKWFCSYRRDGKAAGRMAGAIRSRAFFVSSQR